MDIKQLYSGAEKEAFYPKVKLDSIEDKVNGKTLEQNLQDYNTKIQNLNKQVFGTTSGASNNTSAIDTVPEVYSFLNGYANSTTLQAIINAIPKGGGTTIIEQGSVVSVSGLQSGGASLGIITIDNNNYTIKLPASVVNSLVSYSNLSLQLDYDDSTKTLYLKKNGVRVSQVELPINNEQYVQKPEAPGNFIASYNGGGVNWNSINLSWNPVECDEYKIYRWDDDSNQYSLMATLDPSTLGTNTTWTDSDITTGYSYQYYIVAVDNNLESDKVYSSLIYAQLVIPTPSIKACAYDSSVNTVRLNWGGIADIDKFYIYRNGVKIGEVSGNTLIYDDSTVQQNTTYQYQIAAVVGSTVGEKSDVKSVTTDRTYRVDIVDYGFENQVSVSGDYYIQQNSSNKYTAFVKLTNEAPSDAQVTFIFNGIEKQAPLVLSENNYIASVDYTANDFNQAEYQQNGSYWSIVSTDSLIIKVMYQGNASQVGRNYYVQYKIYHGLALHPDNAPGNSTLSQANQIMQSSSNIINPTIGDINMYNIVFTLPTPDATDKAYYIIVPGKLGTVNRFDNIGNNNQPTYEMRLFDFDGINHSIITMNGVTYYVYVSDTTFNSSNTTSSIKVKATAIL